MMHPRYRLLLSLFLLSGCHSTTDLGTEATSTPTELTKGFLAASSPAEALESVTGGLAIALQDAEIRIDLLKAMRDSPWGKHELDLHGFLETPLGTKVLSLIADRHGVTPENLLTEIRVLPPMDLFVTPYHARRTWRGSEAVSVVGHLASGVSSAVVFSKTGNRVLDVPEGTDAVFLIKPAGRRITRWDGPRNDNSVIQGDNEIAAYYVWDMADGTRFEGSHLDLMNDLASWEEAGPMTTAPPSNGYTRVDSVKVMNICDGGYGGDLELRFLTKLYSETGYHTATANLYLDHPEACLYPPAPGTDHIEWKRYSSSPPVLIPYTLPSGANHYLTVRMYEENPILPDADYQMDVVYSGEDAGRFLVGSPDVSWDAYLAWDQISASVKTSVSVPPVQVGEGYEIDAYATLLDQYGFHRFGSNATWGTDNTAIATVTAGAGLRGWFFGEALGSTTYWATVDGITGTATVTVIDCEEGGQEGCEA